MIFFDLILIFFIGICFGSFANVCIYRLPKNKQAITGRSFCPKCKKIIKWYDNIPLFSFLLLRAKCRRCTKSIPLQYFLVELFSGIGFLAIYLNYQNYLLVAFLYILFLIYIIIFFIDFKHYIIPDSLNFAVIVLALAKNFLPNFNTSLTHDIIPSVLGGVAGYLSIWLIIYLYRVIKKIEGMGLGDAKLMAGIGCLFGWQSILPVLFIYSILGLLFAIPSLMNKKKNLQSEMPFGPFIILACISYFFWGDSLYKLILL